MSKNLKPKASRKDQSPAFPNLPPSNSEQRMEKLLSVCVELFELCIEITGTIDPAAAWLVAHAKDEVTLGAWGTRDLRPY